MKKTIKPTKAYAETAEKRLAKRRRRQGRPTEFLAYAGSSSKAYIGATNAYVESALNEIDRRAKQRKRGLAAEDRRIIGEAVAYESMRWVDFFAAAWRRPRGAKG
jgi:galactokinase